jgi:hypothetical protein
MQARFEPACFKMEDAMTTSQESRRVLDIGSRAVEDLVANECEAFQRTDWSKIQKHARMEPLRLRRRAAILGRPAFPTLEQEVANGTLHT